MARERGSPHEHFACEERGSILVEAALVIPVVLLLALGVVMSGRLVRAEVAVEAVAREAGRSLATASSEAVGIREARERGLAVARASGLDLARLTLVLDAASFARGGTVRARVTYRVELGDLPLLGRVAVTVQSSHREQVERYRSRAQVWP